MPIKPSTRTVYKWLQDDDWLNGVARRMLAEARELQGADQQHAYLAMHLEPYVTQLIPTEHTMVNELAMTAAKDADYAEIVVWMLRTTLDHAGFGPVEYVPDDVEVGEI